MRTRRLIRRPPAFPTDKSSHCMKELRLQESDCHHRYKDYILPIKPRLEAYMSESARCSHANEDLLKRSSLYREFLAEREEILRHKWLESEKAGRDIGFEQALTDWIVKHRAQWRKERQASKIAQN
jgi:hypothetical protein